MDLSPALNIGSNLGESGPEKIDLENIAIQKQADETIRLMLEAGENPADVDSLQEAILFLAEEADEPIQCCIIAGLVYGLSKNMGQKLIAVTPTRLLFVCNLPRLGGKLTMQSVPLDTLERVETETDVVSASLNLFTLNHEIKCQFIGVLADGSSSRITEAFQAAVRPALEQNANR